MAAQHSVMHLSANHIGDRYYAGFESNVIELSHTYSGLRVVVATHSLDLKECLVEYYFPHNQGLRMLDEGDLFGFWDADAFAPGYHLFRIESAGWADQERQFSGMLAVSSPIPEWFVCTSNLCVSVLSARQPEIRQLWVAGA